MVLPAGVPYSHWKESACADLEDLQDPQFHENSSQYVDLVFKDCTGLNFLKDMFWDFPGCPVVKTSPSNAGGEGWIPGQGAKIPHASRPKNQNIKQKQYGYKFNKDFLKKMDIKKNL